MAKLNVPQTHPILTHEGAPARRITAEAELKRSVMACMLWENTFYENGEEIADRIKHLCAKVSPTFVAELAIEAREAMKLRHVPLLLVRELARHRARGVATTLARVIQRPDELSEFLAIYWKDGKQPLSAQVKKGLAAAFTKFNPYQLAKYNRDGAIKLRDVLFLCHAKPKDALQEVAWKQLVDGQLPVPNTWEVALSAGQNKKLAWERLLAEGKLGALALLRNLRNMEQVDVTYNVIRLALSRLKVERVLPYRFIAAARYAPRYEAELETAMFKCLKEAENLAGHTVLLVDVSGSMEDTLSAKSDLTRLDAACGLAMLLREICHHVDIYTFSHQLVLVAPRRGFALRDGIVNSQRHGGTPLGTAVAAIYAPRGQYITASGWTATSFMGQGLRPDRLIVITDEQSHDCVPDPMSKGYMINVASYQRGVGYHSWLHIDGWSESIIDYVQEYERNLDEKIM